MLTAHGVSKKSWKYQILTKFCEHVNEMIAVAVTNFLWSSFLIIRQNVNMATNAILYCGLTSAAIFLCMTVLSFLSCDCVANVAELVFHMPTLTDLL